MSNTLASNDNMRNIDEGGFLMSSIHVRNGFDTTEYAAIPCEDGGGCMDCYPLFDGVTVIRVELETHRFAKSVRRRTHWKSTSAHPAALKANFLPMIG